MKCLMIVTYSFNQDYIAVPCESEYEAQECIKKYIDEEIEKVKKSTIIRHLHTVKRMTM